MSGSSPAARLGPEPDADPMRSPAAADATGAPRWLDARGRASRFGGPGAAFGPRPRVILADVSTLAAASRLAVWHRAALVVDVRGATVSVATARALGRARRVIVADAAERTRVEALGLEAGRVLELTAEPASGDPPAGRAAPGPTTRVATLAAVLVEGDRAAHGRDIPPRPAGVYRVLKRTMDLTVGLSLLIVLAPVLLVVGLLIKLDSPGPALFRQRRIGRRTSEFTILKFRTMAVGTPDLASHLVGPGSSRVTRLGRFLRRASIDELPQLWHLVTGDMSLVGPRPALHNQYDLIALRQADRIDALKPGVTGWAQVNGRDEIPLDRKVAYDREYLSRISLGEDLMILVRTAVVLFSDRGTF